MTEITTLPLTAIDANALPRDRTTLDPAALEELHASIARDGLRQPIEVWRLSTPDIGPDGPITHGLISGLRRLTAMRELAALRRDNSLTTIEAFIRTPADYTEALAAMVAENEIRADPSPWDRGRILVEMRVPRHIRDPRRRHHRPAPQRQPPKTRPPPRLRLGGGGVGQPHHHPRTPDRKPPPPPRLRPARRLRPT